jgi:hypothetical protein
MPDRGPQDVSDASAQGTNLLEAERTCPSSRADSSPEERLVGVDIPDPRDLLLIQEQRLDPHSGIVTHPREHFRREGRLERLDPDLQCGFHRRRREQEYLAEFSDIPIR